MLADTRHVDPRGDHLDAVKRIGRRILRVCRMPPKGCGDKQAEDMTPGVRKEERGHWSKVTHSLSGHCRLEGKTPDRDNAGSRLTPFIPPRSSRYRAALSINAVPLQPPGHFCVILETSRTHL
jgi:hypothetical protein